MADVEMKSKLGMKKRKQKQTTTTTNPPAHKGKGICAVSSRGRQKADQCFPIHFLPKPKLKVQKLNNLSGHRERKGRE